MELPSGSGYWRECPGGFVRIFCDFGGNGWRVFTASIHGMHVGESKVVFAECVDDILYPTSQGRSNLVQTIT